MDRVESRAAAARVGPDRSREFWVLLVLASVQFASIVDFMVIMPLGAQLQGTLDIGTDRFGLVVAAYTFAAGLAGLAATTFIDRFGRKTAFLGLFAGFIGGTFLCGLAPSYRSLLAARFFTGTFGGVLGGMAMAIIGDVFPEHRRGFASGMLMTAFAMASTFGVPLGIILGTRTGPLGAFVGDLFHARFSWQVTFQVLAIACVPIFALAVYALPRLDGHLVGGRTISPMEKLKVTFSTPNHLRAFALMTAMMLGSFSVVTFVSPYLVSNVGIEQSKLGYVYFVGGALSFFLSPLSGWMADRYGKLRVYRVVAPITALLMIVVTNLPRVSIWVAVAVVGSLIVSNAGRMVPAMAMITGSVEPRHRGGFLSANAAVQHLSAGFGATVAGLLLSEGPGKTIVHFERVGFFGAAITLASLWVAGRLRPAGGGPPISVPFAEAAAAQATCDAEAPIVEAEFV